MASSPESRIVRLPTTSWLYLRNTAFLGGDVDTLIDTAQDHGNGTHELRVSAAIAERLRDEVLRVLRFQRC
jgi:hypothetical protein